MGSCVAADGDQWFSAFDGCLALSHDVPRLSMNHCNADVSRSQRLTVDAQHFSLCVISDKKVAAAVEHTGKGGISDLVQLDKQLPFSLS